MLLFILLILLTVIVNIMVIYLVKKNESRDNKCTNISTWKKQYIKYYSYIALGVVTFIYIIPIFLRVLKLKSLGGGLRTLILSNPFQFLLSVFIALGFFNIYFIFKYTKNLEKSKCFIENKNEETLIKALNYYSIGIIVIYILTTLICIGIKLK